MNQAIETPPLPILFPKQTDLGPEWMRSSLQRANRCSLSPGKGGALHCLRHQGPDRSCHLDLSPALQPSIMLWSKSHSPAALPETQGSRSQIPSSLPPSHPVFRPQPFFLRLRSSDPIHLPSDPGSLTPAFLPQTQEPSPKSSSLRPKGPNHNLLLSQELL